MKSLKRALLLVVFSLVGLYALATCFLLYHQGSLMYFPPAVENQQTLAGFEPLIITTADGIKLTSLFSPPEAGQPVILFFHGNGSDPIWEAFKTLPARQKGYGVLMATYRGYRNNPGQPSEKGLFLDGGAYADWISRNYPAAPLVLYGQSLGSAVAIDVASRHAPAALILEVPFYSALSIATRLYPFVLRLDLLMRDPYRSDLKIKNIASPKLFMLAGKDEVVSLKSGLDLYEAAQEPKKKVVFEQAGHNEVYNYDAGKHLNEFLEKVFP